MMRLYHRIEEWWFAAFSEQIRFVLVGGFNTVASYILFVCLNLVFSYQITLIITYFLAINLSIFTMRYYVFRSNGNWIEQYSKAGLTYLFMMALNYIFLYVTVDILGQPDWLAQAEYTILSTIAVYLMHKKVNFTN
ncbi:MAG: GtrA family protein [Alphaproteobacteria bacterium]|nr:GtrA family protein [Alphaproteobacteria bacterium]